MNNFNNDRGFKNFSDRSFGGGNRGRSFGGSRGGFGGGRGREDRQMFSAICDKCGAECELPFRPTGDKPVYCSNCFEKDGSRSSDRFERRGGRDRQRGGGDREMYSAVCDNCGNRPNKPVDVCPMCGSDKITQLDRTCGYLGDNFWNKGRTQEIGERFVHLDNKVYAVVEQ